VADVGGLIHPRPAWQDGLKWIERSGLKEVDRKKSIEKDALQSAAST
jgi:hypothetical protein